LKKLSLSCLSLLVFSFLLSTLSALGQTGLVISQIYGGGGNSSASYSADFVEIYNPTSAAISTAGLSIQYASATGNFTQAAVLSSATIAPGHYFLVQTTTPAATPVGASLPTPDTVATAPNLSATAGKVALVNSTTALGTSDSTCAAMLADTKILDLVGYGSTASCFPGSGTGTSYAPGPASGNNTTSIVRTNPSVNTGDNSKDFSLVSPPNPRNSSFGATAGSLSATGSASPASVTAGQSVKLTVIVTPGTSPASTGITVSGDLRLIGGIQTQAFTDNGDGTFSFTLNAVTTASGVLTLPIAIADSQLRSATTTIALTVNQPLATVAIHDIQGVKSLTAQVSSPYVGQQVQTTGIVTGIGPTGFFIQSPDNAADSNPLTPEGIYVYTGTGKVPATAVIGASVQVTGTISLFPALFPAAGTTATSHLPSTEIGGTLSVTQLSVGNALPTPIQLTAANISPTGSIYQLTPYEGMRVSIASLTTTSGTDGTSVETTETNTSNGQFYAVLTGTARPFREPGIDIRDAAVPNIPANVAHFDDNPERILVDSGFLVGSTPINLSTGAVLASVSGILDFSDTYDDNYVPARFLLDPAYSTANVTAGMTVLPVPAPATGEFTIASYNIDRFYNTNSADNIDYYLTGGGVETSSASTLTAAAYSRRLAKVSLAIRNVLGTPDIVALEEPENESVVADISAQISADALAAGQPDPLYLPYGTGTSYAQYTNDGTGISVGFLVKSTTVNTLKIEQFGQTSTFISPATNAPATLNDRPPLVLHAGVKRAGAKDYPVTVIVNHLKSLISENATATTVRVKKELQAEFLANLIQGYQANGEHVVSVGDYNAFEFSDGYIDILATATGNTPLPADQVVQPGVAGLVTPALTDLALLLPTDQRWSYQEYGSAQILPLLDRWAGHIGQLRG